MASIHQGHRRGLGLEYAQTGSLDENANLGFRKVHEMRRKELELR